MSNDAGKMQVMLCSILLNCVQLFVNVMSCMYLMTDDPGVIDFGSLTCPFKFLDFGFFSFGFFVI